MVVRSIALLSLCLGMIVMPGTAAFALPLDKQACAELKAEHDEKLTPEMKNALEHGPDWVKEHLTTAELNLVRDYLAVEERLEFQCRKGRYIKKYWDIVPLPVRRPEPPAHDQQIVSTSQARAD